MKFTTYGISDIVMHYVVGVSYGKKMTSVTEEQAKNGNIKKYHQDLLYHGNKKQTADKVLVQEKQITNLICFVYGLGSGKMDLPPTVHKDRLLHHMLEAWTYIVKDVELHKEAFTEKYGDLDHSYSDTYMKDMKKSIIDVAEYIVKKTKKLPGNKGLTRRTLLETPISFSDSDGNSVRYPAIIPKDAVLSA